MTDRKLLIFDFDGTLAHTQPALDLALKEFSDARCLPHDTKKMAVGYMHPESCDLGWGLSLDEQLPVLRAFEEFLIHVANDPRFSSPFFDGVHEFLDAVQTEYDCCIVTARDRFSFLPILNGQNAMDRFVTYRTSSCAVERGYSIKPQPDAIYCVLKETGHKPENVIVVGDTTSDIMMARNANVKCIGVLWGAHDRETLQNAGANTVVETVSDLAAAIMRLFTANPVAAE